MARTVKQLDAFDTAEPVTVRDIILKLEDDLDSLTTLKIRLTEIRDKLHELPVDGNFIFEYYSPVTYFKGLQLKQSL